MERLTHKIVNDNEHKLYVFSNNQKCEVGIKLGEFEDVLEKYEIESAEDLDNIINSIRTNTFIDIENKEILELENANLKNELAELKQKAIVPKFRIGQEVFYVAPKRQIVKAIVIGCFENGLIVKCKNRNFIKLLNENIFSSEENAKTSIEKYYKDIHKNYQRNKLNNVYWKMKERCYNTKSLSYINYGAVGITMCDEWKNSYNEFKTWAENNGYKEDIMSNGRNKLTLDRIDNKKGYSPENCRWVTQKEQQNNRRNNRNIKLKELGENK